MDFILSLVFLKQLSKFMHIKDRTFFTFKRLLNSMQKNDAGITLGTAY